MKNDQKRAWFKSFAVLLCAVGCLSVALKCAGANVTRESSFEREEATLDSPQREKPQPFTVSGRVTRANGTGIGGVTITFGAEPGPGRGRPAGAVVTDSDGRWSQSGFETQTVYTATPGKAGFGFQPPTKIFSGPRVEMSFEALINPFGAGGRVTSSLKDPNTGFTRTVGLPGVTIDFSRVSGTGTVPSPVTTDSNGHWLQSGFEGDTIYNATPSAQYSSFSPTTAEFRDVKPMRDLNFEGQFNFFVVSGTVSGFSGARVKGAMMTFQRVSGGGAVPPPVQTDAQGNWNQRFERGTVYQVTPKKEGFVFNPPISTSLSNGRSLNFEGHSILVKVSGRVVRFRDNTPISNAILGFTQYDGLLGIVAAAISGNPGHPGPPQVRTDADGNWSQSGFSRGATCSVQLHIPDSSIVDPWSLLFMVEENAPDVITVADIRVHLSYTVSGRVATADGTGIPQVRISFLDDRGREFGSTETNSSGDWSQAFQDGNTYQVKAAKLGLQFSPRIYSFDGPRAGLNFLSTR